MLGPAGGHLDRAEQAMTTLRPVAELLAALLVAFGCNEPPDAPEPFPEKSAPEAIASEDIDILEAVFRYQFEHNASSGTASGRAKYYFIAIGKSETPANPPAELLARFAGHSPPVEPASLADTSGIVRHMGDGGQGIVLRVESIERIDADTVQVHGGYYEANNSSSGNTYRVERRDGKWAVVDDVMNWIS